MHYRFALITERSERYITSRFNIYRYGCQSDLSDCCRSISISVFNMAHVCTGLKQVLLRQQSSKRFRETDFPHGGSCFLYAGHRNRYFLRLLGSRDNYNDCLNDWKTTYKAKRSFGLMPSNPCSVKLSNELNWFTLLKSRTSKRHTLISFESCPACRVAEFLLLVSRN